jgi:tryptophan 2,3-dioxygenase
MMIFDLSVVAATMADLLRIPDQGKFLERCCGRDASFWLPAMTASGRLVYTASTLLPVLIGFLSSAENRDEIFSSREFGRFRPNLHPASGFQSAQFRLIQRALGKAGLLGVRLFPPHEYWRNYENKTDQGPARVIDPMILRDDAAVADPPPDSPLASAAGIDTCAHCLLDRLADSGKSGAETFAIPSLSRMDLERAIEEFERTLGGHRSLQELAGYRPDDAEEKDREATAVFRHDLENAFNTENRRRAALHRARAGAVRLREIAPESSLALVLNRIVATDTALHDKQAGSFLSLHLHLVARRIRDLYELARQAGEAQPPRGTGGGGIPYLRQMSVNLVPLFPALIAYRDPGE